MVTVKRTAKDMLDMLEKHYAPPPSKPAGGRLITEIQAPNSQRRADALYLPITTSGRGTIIGHEVKVSRADVIAELRDPHKADSWLRYCNRWWLVISDPAYLEGLDVPPNWGVLAPPARANTRFMTVVVKAPELKPDPMILRHAWGTVFARVAYTDIADMHILERALTDGKEWRKRYEEVRNELSKMQRALGADLGDALGRQGRAMKVADIISEVERLGGYGDDAPKALRGLHWQVEPEQVARGILALAVAEDKHGDVGSAVQMALSTAERTATKLREVLAEMDPKGTTA